jgi:hypothetical protein
MNEVGLVRTGKHLGFCPSCQLPIASFDITDKKKGVYTCLGCFEENVIDNLVKERKIEPKIVIDDEFDEVD